MNEEKREQNIPNVIVRVPKDHLVDIKLFLGTTLVTGVPLIGDKIEASPGKVFVVTERTWLSGKDRQANIAITIAEAPNSQAQPEG